MKNSYLPAKMALLAVWTLLSATAYGEENGGPALPVRSVSLFSSGVGYFQHAGHVNGDSSLTLHFKESQINDMLKSLVVEDLDGGRPGSVAYPSQDPMDRVLSEFQVDLTDNPGLPKILDRIRGSRVTVHLGDETVTGIVLGAEAREIATEEDKTTHEWLLNLMEPAGLRTLALKDVRKLEMLDATLKRELENALKTLDQSRGQDRKTVTLAFAGEGKRRVRIGYVVEAPLWKTSYRLLVGGKEGKKAYLQGWAIIENQTEADWENITVSLVSGKPISFVQDLYRPLYSQRPVVETERQAPPPPPSYDAGSGAPEAMPMAAPAPAPAISKRAMPKAAGGMASQSPTRWQEELPDPSRITAMAAATEVGELYRFTTENISLPRRKAAMIPIVTGTIEVEKVSIYNQSVQGDHPLNGVMLHNTSGQHLPAGPMTLFDDGLYAGDSRIKDIPPAGKRLLSYAVDQEVVVNPARDNSGEEIIAGRFVKGILVLTRKFRARKEYLVQNKGGKEKQIILEHPVRSDWKLVETQAPYESTDQWHRFRMVVSPRGESRLLIREERTAEQHMAIIDAGTDFLQLHVKNGAIAEPVRKALEKAAGFKWEMEETERRMQETEGEMETLRREQERVRANIQVLRSNSPQHDQMTKKLMDLENTIEKRLSGLEALRNKREQQRKALEQMLAGLTVE